MFDLYITLYTIQYIIIILTKSNRTYIGSYKGNVPLIPME